MLIHGYSYLVAIKLLQWPISKVGKVHPFYDVLWPSLSPKLECFYSKRHFCLVSEGERREVFRKPQLQFILAKKYYLDNVLYLLSCPSAMFLRNHIGRAIGKCPIDRLIPDQAIICTVCMHVCMYVGSFILILSRV